MIADGGGKLSDTPPQPELFTRRKQRAYRRVQIEVQPFIWLEARLEEELCLIRILVEFSSQIIGLG